MEKASVHPDIKVALLDLVMPIVRQILVSGAEKV